MEEILIGISNYGFPIIITGYLLFRMENKIETLTNSINDLSNNISKTI